MIVYYGLLVLVCLGLLLLGIKRFYNHFKTKEGWREFEILVYNDLKQKYGNAELGRGTKDGGIDCTSIDGNIIIVVQCKAYNKSTIGVKVCRELIGASFHYYEKYTAVKCVIACYKNTKFSSDAIKFLDNSVNNISVWRY